VSAATNTVGDRTRQGAADWRNQLRDHPLIPLTRPASAEAARATTTPNAQPPGWWTNVAVTNPAIDAT